MFQQKGYLIVVMISMIATLFGACASPTSSEGMNLLEDKKWVLQSYGNPDDLTDVLADTEITAEFVSSEGRVKGSAGCNSYFGGYEVEGNQLSMPGSVGSTEMYCMEPEGVMDQEKEYLAALPKVDSFEINDNELQINCGSQVLIFNLD